MITGDSHIFIPLIELFKVAGPLQDKRRQVVLVDPCRRQQPLSRHARSSWSHTQKIIRVQRKHLLLHVRLVYSTEDKIVVLRRLSICESSRHPGKTPHR